MTKQIFFGFVWLMVAIQVNGQYRMNGRIEDEKNNPLEGASVVVEGQMIGSVSGADGFFVLKGIQEGNVILEVSFIGYENYSLTVEVAGDMDVGTISLRRAPYQGEEVTISALRAGEKTPMAFTNMDKDEIRVRNFGQDIPFILGTTPSMIVSSDAGHGIGYTSMRIRGTDANRINVTINGVPLNDAESQSVFWVDLPELASSTDQVQVQRGVGTSTNGAASFGASVNMRTSLLNKDPYAIYDGSVGSYNTLRNSVSAGTGLINEKFALDMRLSDLHSDGYIDRSWTDLQSYYLSAAYYTEKSSLKFITFGGFEELYQSWGGVPSYMLETNRTYNEMGLYTDSSGIEQSYDNQVDHYDQIHYQLHYARAITRNLHLNAALHYTRGEGYYEQYESGEDYGFYSMQQPVTGSDTILETDLVRRKWLKNDFYGIIASLNYEADKSTFILGGGWNLYDGLHFGKVIWAQYMGENEIGHQWYKGTGIKTDWNIYGKYYHYVNDRFNSFVDMQVRGVEHLIDGTDANNRDVTQDHTYLFFNPKAGINLIPVAGQRIFISFARANREPNRNNYTDAPEDREPVKETLYDYEAGYSFGAKDLKVATTFYYMDYNDQLVLTGQINEVGYPVMTNVATSYRIGVELEVGWRVSDHLGWKGNLSLSRNRIKNFINYVDNWNYWDDTVNEPFQVSESIGNSTLAYSPSVVVNNQLIISPIKDLDVAVISKYVGKQYIDNTSNENYLLDPYFVNDLRITYSIHPSWAREITCNLLIANILNHKYESNAWLYRYYYGGEENAIDGYYPQAGTHFMAGFTLKF